MRIKINCGGCPCSLVCLTMNVHLTNCDSCKRTVLAIRNQRGIVESNMLVPEKRARACPQPRNFVEDLPPGASAVLCEVCRDR